MEAIEMKPNPLVTLFKQAIKTFVPVKSFDKEFSSGFQKVKSILDEVKDEDVSLDPILTETATWEREDKAPCTYIEIFENHHLNISIFILKPGFKMPLHDHPHMHGLLKVISGSVRIKSFTKIQPNDERYTAFGSQLINAGTRSRSFLAEIGDKICDASSESCALTPDDSNYHEIESINGPSAFIDILAPPYCTFKDNFVRECRYYKVVQEIDPKLAQLEEMIPPKSFFCDQAPYLGPVLI
ncbi:2-aminoethanethiol dioxygenase [Arctopsyche grandis]|uniref:2-aminoethanethiol dioxygenase n=1 Tax=Arctopsyche grandis TaxID=121162 RepID=UPI00406D9B46